MKFARFLLYPGIFPTDIVGSIVLFLLFAARMLKNVEFNDGIFIMNLDENSKLTQKYSKDWGGTTIGHFVMISPNQAEQTLNHERVHVKQNECEGVCFLILASIIAIFTPIPALFLWILGPWCLYLCGGLIGLCYGKKFYRNNIFEEAAYDAVGEHDRQ